MKRAVIFLNGNRPSKDIVFKNIKTTDKIICADGGAKHAIACGFTPHTIIGDLDSLPRELQKKLKRLPIEWVTFSIEKDFTDSELTLKYAIKKGFHEIVVFGLFGDRMDHVMANMTHFARVVRKKQHLAITAVEKDQMLYFVKEKIVITGKKGQTISLLSLDGDAKGVTTTGLKWKLKNETLHFGESRGVSNEILGKNATVSLREGVLLVIHTTGKTH